MSLIIRITFSSLHLKLRSWEQRSVLTQIVSQRWQRWVLQRSSWEGLAGVRELLRMTGCWGITWAVWVQPRVQKKVINSCCYCIVLVTFCWCSKAVAKANHTAKMCSAGLVLLMLLEERKPRRCSCTSESTASNTVPEMNVLCIFYEKHKKLNSPSQCENVTSLCFELWPKKIQSDLIVNQKSFFIVMVYLIKQV